MELWRITPPTPQFLTPRRNPMIFMTNIMTLIESGVTGLTLTLTIEDLKAFATDMIEQAKAQLLPVMVNATQESCIPKKEVLEMFGVCPTTLWNWERTGYLVPVKMKRKIFYRRADVDRLIIERGRQ